MSRKSVPKRKAGIPLDELHAAHAAHAAGDGRLETLMGRYRGSVVPASTLGLKSANEPNEPKSTKTASKKAPGARLARLDGSQSSRSPNRA